MAKRMSKANAVPPGKPDYTALLTGISDLLERARRMSARSVNSILATNYWEIGRQIVEYEQGGEARAEYGEALLKALSRDLTAKHGRGFSRTNLQQMRLFYAGWEICQTSSWQPVEGRAILHAESHDDGEICQPLSGNLRSETRATMPVKRPQLELLASALTGVFSLSWSHYVRLMSVTSTQARAFYETEAVRGGWSVRQLERQIDTQFYERTSHSKRQAAMLSEGQVAKAVDMMTAEDELRDTYLLEFLNLRDEYSESELEEALIRHLEWFLLELGAGFTFVARQKRIRIGDAWYRIDLLLYHRGLRCLVAIDLKFGAFTHADAGQMNLYLNYAKWHLKLPDEADPVGIILCSEKDNAA